MWLGIVWAFVQDVAYSRWIGASTGLRAGNDAYGYGDFNGGYYVRL